MSFNTLSLILVTLSALIAPFVGVFCFIKGYGMGVKDWNMSHPDEIKSEPAHKQKNIIHATDEKLKMYENLMENIENYDGTSANQKEIN